MKIADCGTNFVHSWVVQNRGLTVLIDTGYAEDWPHFLSRMAAADLDPAALDYLFLTHAHDDHAGFVNDVMQAVPELKVITSRKALTGLRRGQNGPGGGVPDDDAAAICRQMIRDGHGRHRFPAIEEGLLSRFLWVEDGTIGEILPGAAVLALPGHTEDSIGLLWDGALFCGDAAQNRADWPLKTTIWIGDLDAYRGSWQKMIDAQPERIYPGHGAPFDAAELERELPALAEVKLNPSIQAKK